MSNKYKLYLRELGREVIDLAIEAKKVRDESTKEDSKIFQDGYVLGFVRFISLMQLMAEPMDIPLEELGMKDFDPYEELR